MANKPEINLKKKRQSRMVEKREKQNDTFWKERRQEMSASNETEAMYT